MPDDQEGQEQAPDVVQVGGPLGIKISGKLASQAAMVVLLGGLGWFLGPKAIMDKLNSMDHVQKVTQIKVEALIEVTPNAAKEAAKKLIKDRLRVLRLAEGRKLDADGVDTTEDN